MMVDDAYETFFTDHRVETDKKERAMVNVITEDEESGNPTTEQDIAATPTTAMIRATTKFQLQEQPEPATEG